ALILRVEIGRIGLLRRRCGPECGCERPDRKTANRGFASVKLWSPPGGRSRMGVECPLWVRAGLTAVPAVLSAYPSSAVIARCDSEVAEVPIAEVSLPRSGPALTAYPARHKKCAPSRTVSRHVRHRLGRHRYR